MTSPPGHPKRQKAFENWIFQNILYSCRLQEGEALEVIPEIGIEESFNLFVLLGYDHCLYQSLFAYWQPYFECVHGFSNAKDFIYT